MQLRETFLNWQELSLDSPDQVLVKFRERLSTQSASDIKAAIAYLPETAEITDLVDKNRSWGELPLAGVPFLIKDLYDVAGWPTSASSLFLRSEYGIPESTSPLVRRLLQLGATAVGKTHLNEFAYGLSGENLHYGDCPHPLFPERLSGGSSSGSAWAVGKGIVPLALGTDTGGSVRVPAAFCGLFGLRLKPNEWSRKGCFPLSPSFDTVGWFTGTKEDMSTTIRMILEPSSSGDFPRGILLDPGDLSFHPDIEAAQECLMEELNLHIDSSIGDRFLSDVEDMPKHYSVLQSREAYVVHEKWLDRYRDRYSPVVWKRIDRGRHWSGSEIDDAESVRQNIRGFFDLLFQDYDYAVIPASTIPAVKRGQMTEPVRKQLLTLTSPASMAAVPVLTVPFFLDSGLSGGMQIIYRDPNTDLPLKFLEIWDSDSNK